MGEPNIWFLVEKHLKVDVLGIPPPHFMGFDPCWFVEIQTAEIELGHTRGSIEVLG